MLYSQLLTLTGCVALLTPRGVPRGVAVRSKGAAAATQMRQRHGAAAATQLRSMAEDADDFPSDSAVPDEPEPEPTGEEADAPSDVEGDTGEDCAAPAVEAWNEELALDAETALLDRCLGVDRGASASEADRNDVERLARSLEALAPPLDRVRRGRVRLRVPLCARVLLV